MAIIKEIRKSKDKNIYQFKVTLLNIKPLIWRKFQVASDVSLAKLHEILQIIMGWDNYHLHQFIIASKYYGIAEPYMGLEVVDEDKKKLNQVVKAEKEGFVYEYDFGDSWTHKVVLEKILVAEEGVYYPRCVSGKRACPPEDCGGSYGYDNLLSILKNPKHKEYKSYLKWLGKKFDSEAFDLEAINIALTELD